MDDDLNGIGVFALIFALGIVILMLFCVGSASNTPAHQAELAAKEIECKKPKLETTVSGINLYSYRPNCYSNAVYFSTNGTTAWDSCYRSGKTTHCDPQFVTTLNGATHK